MKRAGPFPSRPLEKDRRSSEAPAARSSDWRSGLLLAIGVIAVILERIAS